MKFYLAMLPGRIYVLLPVNQYVGRDGSIKTREVVPS